MSGSITNLNLCELCFLWTNYVITYQHCLTINKVHSPVSRKLHSSKACYIKIHQVKRAISLLVIDYASCYKKVPKVSLKQIAKQCHIDNLRSHKLLLVTSSFASRIIIESYFSLQVFLKVEFCEP